MHRQRSLILAVLITSLAMSLLGGAMPARQVKAGDPSLERGDDTRGGMDSWLGNPVIRTTSQGTATSEWHQEAHDAQHTGFIGEDIPMPWRMKWQWNGSCNDGSDCRPDNPEQGWSFEVSPKSHLVAGDGRLYLPAGAHGVWAINESDGKTAWHNNSIESFCTAAFDPETNALFAATSDGRLYKLNPANGDTIASFQADSGLNLAPTIAVGNVYVVSDSGTLYAVDKNTMTQVWSYSADSPGQTPAVYSENYDVLVFGTADLYLHAVNNSDGLRRWRVKPTVHDPPTYYYTHGWPVIADQHGIVLMRLRMQRDDAFTVPEGWETYPDTNSAIRSFLISNPDKQCLFALNLDDGNTAFVPAVGPGGMERPDKEHSMGPQSVVKLYPNGDEVVYTIWRNRGNCIGWWDSDPNKNYDGGMCEMVLDDSTVPGYEAGDCRFVQFNTPMTVDEMCSMSMAGPTILYSHWISLQSYRITDRSDSRGDTYDNAIQAERQYTILNRIDSAGGCSRDTTTHFCSDGLDAYCDGKYYQGSGFWVFWNCTDPPYQCASAYSDGMKARYAIANNGTIYYELNGGTIFAVGSTSTPIPTSTPMPTNTPNPTATSAPLPTSTPTFAPPPSPTPIPSPTPAEIIIDNPDARFSTSSSQDAWQEYTYAGGQHYGSSHCYNREMGSSQDTATWSFTVPKPGNYDLYAWWWEGDWRPSDVPYTIHYHNGVKTARANQQVNGGQWNLLGNFYFQNEGSVIVSDDVSSGQDIVADAIRLVYRSSVEDHTYLPLVLKDW